MYLEQTVVELKNEVSELRLLIEELINVNKDSLNERPVATQVELTVDEIDAPSEIAAPDIDIDIDKVKAIILKKIQNNVPRKDIQKAIASCGANNDAKLVDLTNDQLIVAAEKIEAL